MMSEIDPKVIVALDFPDAPSALNFVQTVSPQSCRLKVGKELFTIAGPDFVRQLVALGFDVFLDMKFHDIPNTVNKAIHAACQLGVWMVNVHALGGRNMMLAAKQAVDNCGLDKKPYLIAVSVLTSMDQDSLSELGINKTVQQTVSDLTQMSLECGLDGMVCSAQETPYLRQQFGTEPLLVTPGIRPAGEESQDQQRIMTPELAIQSGSSYLVIGRPITQHSNPSQQLSRINNSIQSQLT